MSWQVSLGTRLVFFNEVNFLFLKNYTNHSEQIPTVMPRYIVLTSTLIQKNLIPILNVHSNYITIVLFARLAYMCC